MDLRTALAAALVSVLTWLPSRAENVPAICPAIQAQDQRRTEDPSENTQTPSLVVLGKASGGTEKGSIMDEYIHSIEIEQVLYGHCSAKTLKFSTQWNGADGDMRGIFFLTQSAHKNGPEFQLREAMMPEDLETARALCSARFETLVLSAHAIFLGEEVGAPHRDYHEIKVLRNISGQQFGESQKLRVKFPTGMFSDQPPRPQPGKRLYFIGDLDNLRPDDPRVYPGLSLLPTEVEPAVNATLQRRESYPLVDPQGAGAGKVREVTFDGDVDGALKLLSSNYDAAQLLGQRYLFHNAEKSRERLITEITAAMFQTGVA